MTNRTGKKSQRPFLYRSLASYLAGIFGGPVRKIPVDPGFGCPNRDGTLGQGGCAFCNPESFVPSHTSVHPDPVEQVVEARRGREGEPFIAYVQSGTGTYADPAVFSEMAGRLCSIPGTVGLFVGTRPDCVDDRVMEALSPWRHRKLLWLELGLQSSRDKTLDLLQRGHDAACFVRARELARQYHIPVLAHVILGLPGEDREMMMATADFLGQLEVEGVKIHHLQVIRGTPVEEMLADGLVELLDWEAYPDLVAGFLERLPPRTVVHRLLADAPETLLAAPLWPDKARVLQAVRDHMEREGRWQGKLYRQGKVER